jgi:leucyl/phenylalanyl-tRNA--protein transferase
MFSRRSNASKYALYALSQLLKARDFAVIDCQVMSRHLTTLGAVSLPRARFAGILAASCDPAERFGDWPGEPLRASVIETIGADAALQ